MFVGNGILKTPTIIEAMKKVDRGNFAKFNAYADSPQSIGYAVTISAPHMVNRIVLITGLLLSMSGI